MIVCALKDRAVLTNRVPSDALIMPSRFLRMFFPSCSASSPTSSMLACNCVSVPIIFLSLSMVRGGGSLMVFPVLSCAVRPIVDCWLRCCASCGCCSASSAAQKSSACFLYVLSASFMVVA